MPVPGGRDSDHLNLITSRLGLVISNAFGGCIVHVTQAEHMGRSIHPSGPSAYSSALMPSTDPARSRQHTLRLMESKELIEAELNTYMHVLQSHGADLSTSLLDQQGFPRADIDVAAIRSTRASIIRLRNDLKAVIDDIAIGLQSVYARKEESVALNATDANHSSSELMPFALVDNVAAGSPAYDAVDHLLYKEPRYPL